jgi:hypothetical protein
MRKDQRVEANFAALPRGRISYATWDAGGEAGMGDNSCRLIQVSSDG